MSTVKSRGRQPRVIDLFAGAGVFSFAFADEGFQLVRAIEKDPFAAATYASNLGSHVDVKDVRQVRPEGECDVLIAGPPCQGFSTLGKRDIKDPRNRLSLEVARWAAVLEPRMIVIENVASFLDSPIWLVLARRLGALGYKMKSGVFNSLDFGAPQIRCRSLTFASRRAMPDLSPRRTRTDQLTVRAAWRGLPAVPDGQNVHSSPVPSQLALARMKVIPPGGDKRDVMRRAPELAPPSWWRVPGDVTDVWGRMEWNAPCNTLRTALQNPSKGRYIHPSQHRVISLREAARLHTIPDDWTFVGPPYPVARQIGNSVPPALGRAVAKAVLRALA